MYTIVMMAAFSTAPEMQACRRQRRVVYCPPVVIRYVENAESSTEPAAQSKGDMDDPFTIDSELQKIIDAQDNRAEITEYLKNNENTAKDRRDYANKIIDKFGPVDITNDLRKIIDSRENKGEIYRYLNDLSVPRQDRLQTIEKLRKSADPVRPADNDDDK